MRDRDPDRADHGDSEKTPDRDPRADEIERVEEADAQSMPIRDPVEAALAKALEGASAAGRWDVVAQIAKELEARRLADSKVVVGMFDGPRRPRRPSP